MKFRFYSWFTGPCLALATACGSETSSTEASQAGAGGAALVLDVPEPAMAGTARNPRGELKPVLLYVASSGAGKALYSWDMSSAEPVNVSGSLKADYAVDEFAVSPDGTRVAFINRPLEGDAGEVYLADVDRTPPRRLSGAAVAHISPSHVSWSRGGKYVMYDTEDLDDPSSSVVQHLFDAETGRAVAIHGPISPDDKRVVVVEQGTVAVQDIDGSNRIELAKSKDEPTLSWSADGQMLSMWSKGGRQSVLSADGNGVWRFADCDNAPVWAPQGHWLAYSHKGQFFVQAPGAEELALNDPEMNVVDWHWAPDGTEVAVSTGILIAYALETRKATQVVALPAATGVGLFSWSSDGKYIAYNTAGPAGDELLVSRHDIGDVLVHRRDTGAVSSIEWSPTRAQIAYREANGHRFWYVVSVQGEATFVSDGANGTWSDDGQFFAVEPGEQSSSIRVLRLLDNEIIGPDGPTDGQKLTFGWAHK